MGKLQFEIGQRFAMLTVVAEVERSAAGQRRLLCKCECGNERVFQAWHVFSGSTTHCGCNEFSLRAKVHITHGKSNSRAYGIWCGIKARCFNKNERAYKHYGARGITMCQRWKDNFTAFLADMGEPPTDYQIDRIDNDGNYELGNCRWVSCGVNMRNQRRTLRATINGETRPVIDWCESLGVVAYKTARDRVHQGWAPDVAVTTPKGMRP